MSEIRRLSKWSREGRVVTIHKVADDLVWYRREDGELMRVAVAEFLRRYRLTS